MSLSRKFCVYLHFTPLFTSCRKHELRKRQSKFFVNTLQDLVKNFTLMVLGNILFKNSIFLVNVICFMLSYSNFAISSFMTAKR